MSDQASQLRTQMGTGSSGATGVTREMKTAKVIAVASGKGGVGKSNFCVNFGMSLAQYGIRVLVLDTDVGFANVEVLLNVTPSHSLLDILEGRALPDIVEHSQYGLSFISGGNGLFDRNALEDADYQKLIVELRKLSDMYDVVLLDCSAGVTEVSLQLVAASDELVVVATPEPTAMTDAYALMKMFMNKFPLPSTRIVINRANSFADAKRSANTLMGVCNRFLSMNVEVLGYILEDSAVSEAVMRQVPVVAYAANSRASSCYRQIASNFVRHDVKTPRVGVSGFFERLLRNRLAGGGHIA